MARPGWTNIPDADVDTNSAQDTTLMTALRDNCEDVRVTPVGVHVSEQTTGSGSYVTLASVDIFIPDVADYTGIQRLLTAWLEVKTTSGTATFRLQDNASSNTGTEVTTTSASYEVKEPTLNIDAAWKGTVRTINIQGKTTAGTASMRSQRNYGWRLDY